MCVSLSALVESQLGVLPNSPGGRERVPVFCTPSPSPPVLPFPLVPACETWVHGSQGPSTWERCARGERCPEFGLRWQGDALYYLCKITCCICCGGSKLNFEPVAEKILRIIFRIFFPAAAFISVDATILALNFAKLASMKILKWLQQKIFFTLCLIKFPSRTELLPMTPSFGDFM